MRHLASARALAACLLLAGCGGKDAGSNDPERAQAIGGLAQSVVAKRGVPGIAIAVLRDGKLFEQVTRGSADLGSRQPVTGATPFQLASTTKLFSSAAVLLLVAEGKIRLDDPIGRYLDDLPGAWRRVTVRQLLSHTSGLPDITSGTGDVDLVAGNWENALRVVAGRPMQFEPGTGWAYTQTNYALLLRLVEQVSRTRFEDFLNARLFAPLGMRNTFYPDAKRRCAVNYEQQKDGRIVERPDLVFPHYVHAAGGLCSSLDDLVAWDRALASSKIVPRGLLQQAETPTHLADDSVARVGGPVSYGLGRAIDTTAGHRWAGHSGGNSTAIRHYLDAGLTIIVLHNGKSDPDAIAAAVARAVFDSSAGSGAQAELWDSAGSGDLRGLEAALAAGADVNALDTRSSRNGRYALNWAAIDDHAEAIRLLVKHGAAIDAQNLTGFTALHHAAESGSTEAARALLAAGANPALRNAAGETAADVARRKGHGALAALIEVAPAKQR